MFKSSFKRSWSCWIYTACKDKQLFRAFLYFFGTGLTSKTIKTRSASRFFFSSSKTKTKTNKNKNKKKQKPTRNVT